MIARENNKMQFDKDIEGKFSDIFLKLREIDEKLIREIIKESLVLNMEANELKILRKSLKGY